MQSPLKGKLSCAYGLQVINVKSGLFKHVKHIQEDLKLSQFNSASLCKSEQLNAFLLLELLNSSWSILWVHIL